MEQVSVSVSELVPASESAKGNGRRSSSDGPHAKGMRRNDARRDSVGNGEGKDKGKEDKGKAKGGK